MGFNSGFKGLIHQQTAHIQENTFLIIIFLLHVLAFIGSSSGRIYAHFVGVIKT